MEQRPHIMRCCNSLDQILKVGVGAKDDVQAHFIGVALLILECTDLKDGRPRSAQIKPSIHLNAGTRCNKAAVIQLLTLLNHGKCNPCTTCSCHWLM